MKTIELNNLAVQAQNGDEFAREDILAYFMPTIQRKSQELAGKINNEVDFEHNCYYRILNNAIPRYDITVGTSFDYFVNYQIEQAVRDFTKNRSGKAKATKVVSYEKITQGAEDMDGDSTSMQFDNGETLIEDSIVSMGSAIDLIDKYGTNDRKRFILEAWTTNGSNMSDYELAREMVDVFGKTFDAHQVFIKRFKKSLRESIDLHELYEGGVA